MDMFLQQVLNGLTLGGVYGLVALGLTLVYGILHVPNFAHGAFYMVGAFVSFHAMTAWGFNYWVAMGVSALAVAALSVLAERIVFHPLRNASGLHPMVAAIGVLLTLQAPTDPMRAEAAGAGWYESPLGTRHPRLQILTIAELLAGKGIDYPRQAVNQTYEKAPREKAKGKQGELGIG